MVVFRRYNLATRSFTVGGMEFRFRNVGIRSLLLLGRLLILLRLLKLLLLLLLPRLFFLITQGCVHIQSRDPRPVTRHEGRFSLYNSRLNQHCSTNWRRRFTLLLLLKLRSFNGGGKCSFLSRSSSINGRRRWRWWVLQTYCFIDERRRTSEPERHGD